MTIQIVAVQSNKGGFVAARIEDTQDRSKCLALVEGVVSDKSGVHLKDVNIFDLRLLTVKEEIKDFIRDVQWNNIRRRELVL